MRIDAALLTLLLLLTVAATAALWKGRWPLLLAGLKQAAGTFRSMWLRMLLGMTLGGLVQVLIPSALIAQWLGPASGLKGILIGSYIGLFLSGGPFVILPVVAAIYQAGASPGPVIALLAGGMLHVQELITYQIPFLGIRLPLARYAVCIFVPPLVGFGGGAIYQLLNLA
ncbi:MAG: permease [Chloroflexi bacterium]|nr:permease [Chloroflexota bacterium]